MQFSLALIIDHLARLSVLKSTKLAVLLKKLGPVFRGLVAAEILRKKAAEKSVTIVLETEVGHGQIQPRSFRFVPQSAIGLIECKAQYICYADHTHAERCGFLRSFWESFMASNFAVHHFCFTSYRSVSEDISVNSPKKTNPD